MITQYEVPSLLRQEVPAMIIHIASCKPTMEVYSYLHDFVDYTRHAVEDHNFLLAKRCFLLADRIYVNGDKTVKSLIENSIVYSISSIMPSDSKERLRMKSIIPSRLYSMYIKQSLQSGC